MEQPVPLTRGQRVRRYLLKSAVQLGICFLLYALSIGPMFWYWFQSFYVGGPKWIAKFYMPLLLLCSVCPPIGTLVNWYINLWIL